MSFWQKAWIKLQALLKAALPVVLFVCLEYAVFSAFVYLGIDRKIYKGVYNLATCILVLIAMLIFNKISSKKKDPLFRMSKLAPDQVTALVIVGLGMLGFVTTYLIIAEQIAQASKPMTQAIEDYRESVDRFAEVPQVIIPVWDSVLYVVTLCFFVPITEEMTFRGACFGQLRKGFGPWVSVILCSLGFGLMHGLSIHIGYAIGCGLIIASCYYITDSLIAPVILHMVFNIFGSGVPTLLSLECFNIPDEYVTAFMKGVNTVSIVFMPVSVLAFAYLVSVKRKKDKEAKAMAEVVTVTVQAEETASEDSADTDAESVEIAGEADT